MTSASAVVFLAGHPGYENYDFADSVTVELDEHRLYVLSKQ
jgi:hypothetical protein